MKKVIKLTEVDLQKMVKKIIKENPNTNNPILVTFLEDVCQGVYGETSLTYKDVYEFLKMASESDIETIKDFYWDWNSYLTDEDEIDVNELEEFIYQTLTE